MTAACICPNHRPEHFLVASLLNQNLFPVISKYIHRESLMQFPVAGVGVHNLGYADGGTLFINKSDGAGGHEQKACWIESIRARLFGHKEARKPRQKAMHGSSYKCP